MSDIAFKIPDVIAEDIYKKGYKQGRADGYSKAENDYHEKHQDILIKQYEGGCEQGRADERERIVKIVEQSKLNAYLTLDNSGNEKLDFAYENIANCLDKIIEEVRGGENE